MNFLCKVGINFKNINLLREIIKDNIDVIYDKSIFSNSVIEVLRKDGKLINKIDFDCIINYFKEYFYNKVYKLENYDRYYLKNALKDIYSKSIDTIVVGSSYARFGFEENSFKLKSKNLSLPSQDIYYACRIAETAVEKNSDISKIIFGLGYYSFFHDLSKTKDSELARISNTYYPLLNDIHNALFISKASNTIESNIFDIDKISDKLMHELYVTNNESYFCEHMQRFMCKVCYWDDSTVEWKNLSNEAKKNAGQQRAESHNKLLKHNFTYDENIEIFCEFTKEMRQKGIDIYVVIFPFSKYYMDYLNGNFKKYLLDALNKMEEEIHLIDLNNCSFFEDSDFNDSDHLSSDGAIKATDILNDIIVDKLY